MISIWVLVVACVIFMGILINERIVNAKLTTDYIAVCHFLDLYIEKYGPSLTSRVIVVDEGEDADK